MRLDVATSGACREERYRAWDDAVVKRVVRKNNEDGEPLKRIIDGKPGTIADGEIDEVIDYVYDGEGRVEAIRKDSDSDGRYDSIKEFLYDADTGQLTHILFYPDTRDDRTLRRSIYYNPDGTRSKVEHHGDIYDTYLYEDGLLTQRKTYLAPSSPAAGVDNFDYESGLRVRWLEDFADPKLSDREWLYAYNCDGQLSDIFSGPRQAREGMALSPSWIQIHFSYDEQGRLVERRSHSIGSRENYHADRIYYECTED